MHDPPPPSIVDILPEEGKSSKAHVCPRTHARTQRGGDTLQYKHKISWAKSSLTSSSGQLLIPYCSPMPCEYPKMVFWARMQMTDIIILLNRFISTLTKNSSDTLT